MCYQKTCETCHKEFVSSWPNGRYCSKACRISALRERARRLYAADTDASLSVQAIKKARRVAARWKIIFHVLGRCCTRCGEEYPVVVYDLHHPHGKSSPAETPSRIIAGASQEIFLQHLSTWELLCANCHRLHHAEHRSWAPRRKSTVRGNCVICGEVVTSSAPGQRLTCSTICDSVLHGISGKGSRIRTGE